jgi:cell division GTPase FtsZ
MEGRGVMNTGGEARKTPWPITTRQAGYGEGDKRIEALAVVCGKDVAVTIVGGDSHHIGAVAMAVPRPGLKDPSKMSASASVLCVTGHKDDELARFAALKIASALNCTASVNVGIHIDQASEEDLKVLIFNSNYVVDKLIHDLRKEKLHARTASLHKNT